MAKGSGGTRSGSASNPRGVGQIRDEGYYYDRREQARERYERLSSQLESSYPLWQRQIDFERGGGARELMRERMKPMNDAYKAYQDAIKAYDGYRTQLSLLENEPPSRNKQKEIVASLNDTISNNSGTVYLANDSLSSIVLSYNSKEDLRTSCIEASPFSLEEV